LSVGSDLPQKGAPCIDVKYIGMDVHNEAISIAVLNSSGKLAVECTIETKANTILNFLKGLLTRGELKHYPATGGYLGKFGAWVVSGAV
jgi:hypothetical protein